MFKFGVARVRAKYLGHLLRYRSVLDSISLQDKSRVAIIDKSGNVHTYNGIITASQNLAARLQKQLKHDAYSVGGFCKSPESSLVSMLACWMIGKVFVPLSETHSNSELSYLVSDSKVAAIVCKNTAEISEELKSSLSVPLVESSSCFTSKTIDELHVKYSNGDDALIIYTSGTTGRPKGVVHTHNGVESMVKSLVVSWKYSYNDKILHFLPLYHVHGLLNKLLCILCVGGTAEFMPSANANAIWERLAKQSDLPTLFMAVPTVYAKLIESSKSQPQQQLQDALKTIKQMRLMVCGSAALPDPIMDGWKLLTGHMLLERYGMTEIGMALTNPYEGVRKKGYVGLPFPNVECCLVDEQEQIITEYNKAGELRIKGPCVFSRYLNLPEVTKESFDRNGWFKTGDVAERSEDGYYKILGRSSTDIIKSSGYKISALEIERELLGHPEILEAAVIAIPDVTLGEKIVAVLTIRDVIEGKRTMVNENTLNAISFKLRTQAFYHDSIILQHLKMYLKDKLVHYKHPKEVYITNSIPRNHLGKANKKKLMGDVKNFDTRQ